MTTALSLIGLTVMAIIIIVVYKRSRKIKPNKSGKVSTGGETIHTHE